VKVVLLVTLLGICLCLVRGNMKAIVFCGWGEGSDVGINVYLSEKEAKRHGVRFFCMDFTAEDAILFAKQMIQCAEKAKRMDEEYGNYVQMTTKVPEGY